MIKRTVEVSNPSQLRMERAQLVIEQNGVEAGRVPVEDLGVLILDHPAIVLTQALLIECWSHQVLVLLCDSKHLPGAVLQPLEGHTLHARILGQQIAATEPTKKRLWQQIVQAKIQAQARTLDSVAGAEMGKPLAEMSKRVKTGDPDNLEAQAARIYWVRLFGDSFRRDREAEGINALLNYGYAIVRAAVARAICGAGLHPALGVHHDNQYNAYALADDLVEPLRPLVDMRVHELMSEHGGAAPELERPAKQRLLDVLTWPVSCGGDARMPLMVALHSYAATIRRALVGETKLAEIPVA